MDVLPPSPELEQPPHHVAMVLIAMASGILIAIWGTVLVQVGQTTSWGILLLAFGTSLIFCQYVGVYRRNQLCLLLASSELTVLALISFFMLLGGLLPVAVTMFLFMAIVRLNWQWGQMLLKEKARGIEVPPNLKWTMIELLGLILILALILGPASVIARTYPPYTFR